jgi:hypothetical protein
MTHTAASAASNAGGVAHGMSTGVKQGVYNSRAWAAPRLDSAADYCTNVVAPQVSAALRSSARQVHPGDIKGTGSKGSSKGIKGIGKAHSKGSGKMSAGQKPMKSRVVTWVLLGLASCAAAGAAAALARYRYKESIAVNTETADEAYVVTEEERRTATFYPAATDPVEDGDMPTTDRVRSQGW